MIEGSIGGRKEFQIKVISLPFSAIYQTAPTCDSLPSQQSVIMAEVAVPPANPESSSAPPPDSNAETTATAVKQDGDKDTEMANGTGELMFPL